MRKQQLISMLLLVSLTLLAGGCRKPRSVVGRWKSGPTNYYFREDGVLFYVAPSGARYRGAYYVDNSSSPWVISSRLSPMDGVSGDRDVTWEMEFLTNDRIRATEGDDEE